MTKIKSISIFCGAHTGRNPNFEKSAKIFTKKKKLLEKNESYEKKLAKMARAGFSYDICKKILG